MKLILLLLFCFSVQMLYAQKNHPYNIAIRNHQKNYVSEHEVVKKKDKKYFRFYTANKNYQVLCDFIKLEDTVGIIMKTSGGSTKQYFKYGILNFKIAGTPCSLFVFQSRELMAIEKYKDYLFIPFTDLSTGDETYGSGRYLDISIKDISFSNVLIDFNKAYNPYCAYAKGFKCPIPPRENALNVSIFAGEKNFGKLVN